MASKKERRKWALELAAALLRSDMDTYAPESDGFDAEEADKRIRAVCAVADELEAKAKRMR